MGAGEAVTVSVSPIIGILTIPVTVILGRDDLRAARRILHRAHNMPAEVPLDMPVPIALEDATHNLHRASPSTSITVNLHLDGTLSV